MKQVGCARLGVRLDGLLDLRRYAACETVSSVGGNFHASDFRSVADGVLMLGASRERLLHVNRCGRHGRRSYGNSRLLIELGIYSVHRRRIVANVLVAEW